jgi:hypothetical protein
MSASELACICVGMFCNVLTFLLGTAVGIVMVRSQQDAAPGRERRQRGEE